MGVYMKLYIVALVVVMLFRIAPEGGRKALAYGFREIARASDFGIIHSENFVFWHHGVIFVRV